MPKTGPLTLLRQVREGVGLTQPDMATYFGFIGPNGRNTVARWENGEGNPPAMKHRRTFMTYLGVKLGLRSDRQRFAEVWHTLEEHWDWPTVTDHEWTQYVAESNSVSFASAPGTQLAVFSELTDQQRQLLMQIIREVNTGHYYSEFRGIIEYGSEWELHLDRKGGGEGVVFEDIERPDLEALEEAGYMRLSFKRDSYSGSLKPKALQQYQLLDAEEQSPNKHVAMSTTPSTDRTGMLASCFISYSTQDEEFATLLHNRLIEAGLRAWFAPADMRSGKKMHEQISQAIREQDRLLLVLSEHSLKSPWVETEIRKARRMEQQTGQQKLFPIRLVDIATLRAWERFDADTGEDLAVEVREYFIPDFSNWQDTAAFEQSLARLVNDLQKGQMAPNAASKPQSVSDVHPQDRNRSTKSKDGKRVNFSSDYSVWIKVPNIFQAQKLCQSFPQLPPGHTPWNGTEEERLLFERWMQKLLPFVICDIDHRALAERRAEMEALETPLPGNDKLAFLTYVCIDDPRDLQVLVEALLPPNKR